MKKNKVYFKNLNSFRFFAAFFVIIHHVELFLIKENLIQFYSLKIIKGAGQIGVTFFFVLSGFLITYLLLHENRMTQNISIKNFYLRRILRIWPLYYLLVILGFFLFPNIPSIYKNAQNILNERFYQKLIEFIAFIPNFTLSKFNEVPFASHLWSIGVEEQFYLIWPIIIKFLKNKLNAMLYIIFGMLFLKAQYFIFNSLLEFDIDFFNTFREFLRLTRLECMAIGGIGAYILHNKKHNILNLIFSKWVQYITYILISILIIFNILIPLLHNYIYSFLFIILILNISSNSKSLINLENKTLHYLGKISYGLYMYHPICIAISFWIMRNVYIDLIDISYFDILILSVISFTLTFFVSIISYHFIESKFLKLKTYFK